MTAASSETGPEEQPSDQPLGPFTREQLYELVWQEPMLRIGERLGLSSSYMARVCTEMRVPRPQPGYWAQVEFGKKPDRPPLPEARPGDVTQWAPGSPIGTVERAAKQRTGRSRRPRLTKEAPVLVKVEPAIAAETLEKLHPLLVGIKPHFAKTRDADNGILRPFKRLMADIQSSAEGLDAAVRAADKLYRALTAHGHRVTLAPPGELSRDAVDLSGAGGRSNAYRSGWWPERPTVVYVGEVPIGLSLFEMTVPTEMLYAGDGNYVPIGTLTAEQRRRMTGPRYWTTTRDFASGRLCLQAYCPSRMVTWVKRWPETKHGQFGSMLPAIVKELEATAPELTKKLEAAEIEAEERRRRWEEEARRRREAEERAQQERRRKEARDELLVAIARWDDTRRVLSYFAEVEVAASHLEAEARELLMERLQKARQLIGELAPLELLQRWRAPDERQ